MWWRESCRAQWPVVMARDHRKLRVFHEAHQLVIEVYRQTHGFPKDEWFGVRAQLRRAAVSVASNMVEGSARRTVREYSSFVNVARGSAAEVEYLVMLTSELGFLTRTGAEQLQRRCEQLIPQLESLIQKLDGMALRRPSDRRSPEASRQSRDA